MSLLCLSLSFLRVVWKVYVVCHDNLIAPFESSVEECYKLTLLIPSKIEFSLFFMKFIVKLFSVSERHCF